MQQLLLPETGASPASDQWCTKPLEAFEHWQRYTPHSEGFLYAERSIRQHCAMWRNIIEYLDKHALTVLTVQSDRLADFLDHRLNKSGNPAEDSTKRRYLKLLGATFDHLERIGVRRDGNPCAILFRYYRPAPVKNPGALDSTEDDCFVEMVLAQPARNWREVRDQAMMVLIIGSGLYTSEIVGLQLDQLMLDAEPPHIHINGHGKVPERKAPIIHFALAPLRTWLAVRAALPLGKETTVFVSGKGGTMLPATLYRKVQAILKGNDASLKPRGGFGPQILRNSFLMRQLASDKPVDIVQQWAGHIETKSTLRFRQPTSNAGTIDVD